MKTRVQRKPRLVSIAPQPTLPDGLDSANVFRDKFAALNDDAWFAVLLHALDAQTIEGVRFPQYPPAELQNRIHGYSNAHALREAFDYYSFIKSRPYLSEKFSNGSYYLDFAAGWGRMSRAFLRDFDLSNVFSYEPNRAFCVIARTLNPYTCFINGGYYPDNTLPQSRFDLVTGYSIFTHLSPEAAWAWLAELARAMRPDGHGIFTTWGKRFLDRLVNETKDLAEGREIHWYSKSCLEVAGNVEALLDRYNQGEFIWFSHNPGSLYGEAFIPPQALTALLKDRDIPLELVEFDQDRLAQDVFVVRRKEASLVQLVHPPAPASGAVDVNRLAQAAWDAMQRRDWDEAIQRWEAVRAASPDRADGYIAACHALREAGRLDDAEAVGLEAVTRFPESPDALTAHAWVATTREDWAEAGPRWKAAQNRFPERADVYLWPTQALRRAHRLDEAEVMSTEAVRRIPADPEILTEHAWIAMGRWDWEAAVRRWEAVRAHNPDQVEAHVWPIKALRLLHRLPEAEAMVSAALARFPENPVALAEQMLLAVYRDDWKRAAEYLEAASDRLVISDRADAELAWIAYRIRVKALAAQTGGLPVVDAPSDVVGASGLAAADLMLRFESLGQRCDLGAVQRYYGAEPLDLLRFAGVPYDALIAALDARFEGLGTADDTAFAAYDGEYYITSRRYRINFHTCVYTHDLPAEADRRKFFQRQRRRLEFLRDKLVADLEASEKIFVYANYERLSDDEISRLHAAVKRYGARHLLCIRPAEIGHPDGTVEPRGDGLFVAYLGLFAYFHGGEAPPYASWRTIFEKTHQLSLEADAPPPAVKTPETFCIRPWHHFRLEANGQARVCCLFEGNTVAQDGVLMSSQDHSLAELWNSDTMREVRRDMVEGRRVEGCRQCYTVEDRGGISTRVRENAEWEAGRLNPSGTRIAELVTLAVDNDFNLPTLPGVLEVEVGNLCNFKCRMCHGGASTRVAKDVVHQSWAEDGFYAAHHDPAMRPGPYRFNRATSIKKLGEDLANSADGQVKRLYFTGGEPMLVREVNEVLQTLVTAGRSQDIELTFVSNGSVLPRWTTLAPHFRNVQVSISVDGFEKHYDYIRYPGRWQRLVEHLQTLQRLPNIELAVTTTVQVNNALNVTRLFRYLDSVGIPFSAYLLHGPRYLAVSALPRSIRLLGAQRLRDYADSDCPAWRRNLILSLAAEFEGAEGSVDPAVLRDLMLFSNDLDATRGQNIRETDPELVALLAEAGFPWIDERLHANAAE